jgi:adenosine deaminase
VDLRTTSKVELHRHLEGAIRLQTVFDLSRQAGLPLPADSPEGLARYALIREPVDSLEEALRAFAIAQSSVRTYDAVRRIAREAVEDLHGEGVRLAELRYSPEFMCSPGRLDWDASPGGGAGGRGGGHLERTRRGRGLHRGARATLNTDDPGLMGIDLVHEWNVARDRIGFTDEDFHAVTPNALAASFLPEAVVAEVRRRHFGWLDR